jgi:MoxR-like ATPase
MVLATQNPLEYEGTHPLPESQLDRFLLRFRIGYPDPAHERAILRGAGGNGGPALAVALSAEEVLALQAETERVRVDDRVLDYLMAIVAATRVSPMLTLGVSPRGALALLRAARAHALTDGRDYVVPDDVKRLAVPALSHRIIVKAHAGKSSAGVPDGEVVIRTVLQGITVPR